MDANKAENRALMIDEVIRFLSAAGNAERALAAHHELPNGLCSGCLTRLTRWPCSVANLALQAQKRQR